MLLDHIKRMLVLGVSPGVETLRDHVLPGFPSTPTSPSMLCRQLGNLGLAPSATATPVLATLIRMNAFEAAAKFGWYCCYQVSMTSVMYFFRLQVDGLCYHCVIVNITTVYTIL